MNPQFLISRLWLVAVVTLCLPLSAFGQHSSHSSHHDEGAQTHLEERAAGDQSVPLYDNLGTHSYPITTSNPTAQKYFDQGLRLTYAFNHPEAIRAYREAARIDSDCAMCYWGIAYAYGPNINAPMGEAEARLAYEAVQEALARASGASPREQALIEALAARYAETPGEDRSELDAAYALAMADVARQFPDDQEIATLYAEALMDLSPWNYWTKAGEPGPHTMELLTLLEGVVGVNPDHPGACHFYIHAVEATYPEKAVACAERLAQLMPGAGHLVHMPAHIYIRVGRWSDAIEANIHAVHSDETYIADQRPEGIYPIAYYPHNYHFLSFAATMVGRSEQAIAAARSVVENVPLEIARAVPEMEPMIPFLHLTLVTFGRWDDVLAEPVPPEDLTLAHAMVQYARGVAFAAMNDWAKAEEALTSVEGAATVAEGASQQILQIASHALSGEIAARQDMLDEAIAHFTRAMELEDEMIYFEPPMWYYPIRHSLGAVLLKAGRPAEAEALYRQDLTRFPDNGWSLTGLAQSLRDQERTDEASELDQHLNRGWDGADVDIAASRL